MLKFIGNCNEIIDWNYVIKCVDESLPAYVGPRHDVGHPVKGVDEVAAPIRDAGYKFKAEGGNASWGMYIPGQQFPNEIVSKFMKFVGMESYINCWISKIYPGDVAPWHWDITDDEKTLNASGNLRRFHCHIDIPRPGHTFIVEDTCFYNEEQGNVYEWPDRKSWHAGANAGLTPKYLFNIWG
jgi:hypothetical protein